MGKYTVTIVNGSGSLPMKEGTYTVAAVSAPGYDLSTLSPTSFVAGKTAGSGVFTLSATGTLTFNVNETGAAGGTPVTGGTLIMTDSAGNAEYGTAVTIKPTGEAVFENVPFGDATTPFTLYFKQLTADDTHNVYDGVITVSMTSQTQTEYIRNEPIAQQSFTLTDANYAGLVIPTATLDFD